MHAKDRKDRTATSSLLSTLQRSLQDTHLFIENQDLSFYAAQRAATIRKVGGRVCMCVCSCFSLLLFWCFAAIPWCACVCMYVLLD
jgi:hypothetical protein